MENGRLLHSNDDLYHLVSKLSPLDLDNSKNSLNFAVNICIDGGMTKQMIYHGDGLEYVSRQYYLDISC